MTSVSLAVSVSELCRFPTQDISPLTHVLPLSRSTRSTDKNAQRTPKTSSRTLFRSRPFRFLLFSLVSLHQPLNVTHALVEVLSFAWFSDIVSPFPFSCLHKLWNFCICNASVCVEWNRFVCKWNEHAPNRKKPSRKAWEIQVFSKNKKYAKKIFGTRTQALKLWNFLRNICNLRRRPLD